MAFTKVLYYPWIDIHDEAWLKNAMLYWEEVRTIVPHSIDKPYEKRTAQEFYSEGLLKPLIVESRMVELSSIRSDVLNHLESREGQMSLRETVSPNPDIDRLIEIHLDKFSMEVRQKLVEMGFPIRRGEWFLLPPSFAGYYMTLLAVHLSENIGIGLIADNAIYGKLSDSAKLGAIGSSPFRSRFLVRKVNKQRLAECMLADLIVDVLQISPDTPVKKVIMFRKKHADEIGIFRAKVAELTRMTSSDQPIAAIRQSICDIYTNEVIPALNNLKKALNDKKITWSAGNIIRIAFFTLPSSSILLSLGISIPYAVLAGAGISLAISAIEYNREKATVLRQNPYSYLLTVEKTFGKIKR
jgi:hypothetical protein